MTAPFIIDVHTHIGPTQGFEAHHGALDAMLATMDLLRVEVACFSAMPLLENQFDSGHRMTLKALENHPDRLRAYGVFNPNWPEPSMRSLEDLMPHPGFVGVKIHPAMHAAGPEDERYIPLWDLADTKGLVVLAHTWSPDPAKPAQDLSVPERFEPVLRRYERVRLILGHCGGRGVGLRQAVQAMNACPNCYAELSGDSWPMGQLEWLCRQVDTSRLLFGTDMNWIEPRYVYGHVLKADIPAETRLGILRENAIRLFGKRLSASVC